MLKRSALFHPAMPDPALLETIITRRRLVAASALGAGAAALGGCGVLGPDWRYRYRLTGWVDCDGTAAHGSSVIEVTRTRGYNEIGGTVRGEAVAIDLPGGKTLFLLLSSGDLGIDWGMWMPHHAFAATLDSAATVDGKVLDRLAHSQGASATLAATDYPTMVRFRDTADPASIERVDPANLAASFGEGARFKGITIQLTDDRVTTGITGRLPWLTRQRGGLIRIPPDVATGDGPFGAAITAGDFKRG